MSVLFLGKENDPGAYRALQFCQMVFPKVSGYFGRWGEPFPEAATYWQGDYIVSYLSRWIVPETVLSCAKLASVNFHPGPPEYPGIGCNNWALYDEAERYGVTAHHMSAAVDAGTIIATTGFPIFPADTVATLQERTYDHLLVLFQRIVGEMALGKMDSLTPKEWPIPWTGKLRSRAELDALMTISPDMSAYEIKRRIRATAYDEWQPYVELGGHRFEYMTS